MKPETEPQDPNTEPQLEDVVAENKGEWPEDEALKEEKQTGGAAPETSGEGKKAEPDWKDQYLRLAADFENFRKRTLREKEEIGLQSKARLLEALLPAVDDLARALSAAKTSENLQSIQEGIALAQKKLLHNLSKQGVEEIPDVGHPFDSDLHEAVVGRPAQEGEKPGTIVDVLEKGYKFQGRVIRYAKVVVAE